MKKLIVLGGGMVGSAMAMDLARDADGAFEVTLADAREAPLALAQARWGVRTLHADLGDPAAVARAVAPFDLVLGALPSRLGLQTLRAVIDAGRNYCDISFLPQDRDAMALDAAARERGVTVVFDCGVAPGMSNMLAGQAARELAPCERLAIYVGGLPVVRRWPYQYKAGFSPADVLEEYVRPARLVEHGRVVVREALSEPEPIEFASLGTLEAFNTDGLRSLAYTLEVPFMKEKTVRYPGHGELMRVLRETGFLSETPVQVDGQPVRPLDVTARLLFPRWTFADGEADVTVMRVIADGVLAGEPVRRTWELLDRYDPATGLRSMSRSTAFPATAIARRIARGEFARPGVHPPERLVDSPGLLDGVLRDLEARGVHFTSRTERRGAQGDDA